MKIAIAGYGIEGEASFDYWNHSGNEITVVDESNTSAGAIPESAATILGPGAFEKLDGFDLVIRTAGLDPSKIKTDGKIWSATNEFFEKCQAPIIGVTGSKGKGTTSSLVSSILSEAGFKTYLVGNIGISGLEVLTDIKETDVVVYELSSFQLWDIEKSPHVAAVLFIEPEHLDVHHDFDDYLNAKSNIIKFQTNSDSIVYSQNNTYSYAIAQQSLGQKIPYQDGNYSHATDGWFWYGEQKLCSVDSLQLIGDHNLDNTCAAIDLAREYTQDTEAITRGISSFSGLPHRLKLVSEIGGVKYYDDSIATTPSSAIAALDAFDQPKVLILGGSSKGADFTLLAHKILNSNIREIVLMGAEANKIEVSLQDIGFETFVNLGSDISMSDIVKHVHGVAQPGDVVMLSPSCASFGMFKNYADRGEQFIEAVNNLDD